MRSVTVIASEGEYLADLSSSSPACALSGTRGAPLFWKGKRSPGSTPGWGQRRGRFSWSLWVRPVKWGREGGLALVISFMSLQGQWRTGQVWRKWSQPQCWRCDRAGHPGVYLGVLSLPLLIKLITHPISTVFSVPFCRLLFILKANSLFAIHFSNFSII